ncbi:MAG: tyrosine-protein phosphatase, partial [Clostridia bacterium]|nr:tyrosine-protein phosphatase [Clostridia bacterium]
VHCTEGKDRTGFVCMLLEALVGASYEEIEKDYMITYDNYYGINPEKDSARYTVIVENVLQPMIKSMTGKDGVDIKSADLSVYAREFIKSGGMTDEEITTLRNNISE